MTATRESTLDLAWRYATAEERREFLDHLFNAERIMDVALHRSPPVSSVTLSEKHTDSPPVGVGQ